MSVTTWQNRITGYGTEEPDQLVANPKNWRVHPTNQQAALKGSLTELGWIQNVIVNQRTGFVLDGHARVALALRHSQTEVPVTYVDLSEEEEALALATLDPISAMAGADKDQLEALLADITTQDAALLDLVAGLGAEHGIGFGGGLTDPDEVPEPPEEPITKPGDLWLLGEHRLLCGDATVEADVARLTGGVRANLIFADPPYGIDLIHGTSGKVGGGTKQHPTAVFSAIVGDDRDFDPQFLLALADSCIVWGGNYFADKLPASRCWFIWNKNHAADRTFAGCELAWTNLDRHAKIYASTWDGYTKEGESGSKVHPAQKPVKLCADIIEETTVSTDLIFDPFLGSGTTLIAAEQLGRRCYGMEIDPAYCDVIVRRWENFTGQTASRERIEDAA